MVLNFLCKSKTSGLTGYVFIHVQTNVYKHVHVIAFTCSQIHPGAKLKLFINIYNGNIFPSLNPAKIFQFISRWTESTKSSAVGPNHRAVINTSNEVKSPLLWEFWIYNFSLRIIERVLRWKHCKYKEWVSFFWVHGEWIVARNKQIGREPLRGSRDLFVPCYDSFPMNPEKKTLIP